MRFFSARASKHQAWFWLWTSYIKRNAVGKTRKAEHRLAFISVVFQRPVTAIWHPPHTCCQTQWRCIICANKAVLSGGPAMQTPHASIIAAIDQSALGLRRRKFFCRITQRQTLLRRSSAGLFISRRRPVYTNVRLADAINWQLCIRDEPHRRSLSYTRWRYCMYSDTLCINDAGIVSDALAWSS